MILLTIIIIFFILGTIMYFAQRSKEKQEEAKENEYGADNKKDSKYIHPLAAKSKFEIPKKFLKDKTLSTIVYFYDDALVIHQKELYSTGNIENSIYKISYSKIGNIFIDNMVDRYVLLRLSIHDGYQFYSFGKFSNSTSNEFHVFACFELNSVEYKELMEIGTKLKEMITNEIDIYTNGEAYIQDKARENELNNIDFLQDFNEYYSRSFFEFKNDFSNHHIYSATLQLITQGSSYNSYVHVFFDFKNKEFAISSVEQTIAYASGTTKYELPNEQKLLFKNIDSSNTKAINLLKNSSFNRYRALFHPFSDIVDIRYFESKWTSSFNTSNPLTLAIESEFISPLYAAGSYLENEYTQNNDFSAYELTIKNSIYPKIYIIKRLVDAGNEEEFRKLLEEFGF